MSRKGFGTADLKASLYIPFTHTFNVAPCIFLLLTFFDQSFVEENVCPVRHRFQATLKLGYEEHSVITKKIFNPK